MALLIRIEHARVGKHYNTHREKREFTIAVSERRCSAVGLAGEWLCFAFLRVRGIFIW